ncbi:MAG: hypothetical protein Q8P49_03045 [Candidatus Liptonbacteria bacterium]|nr:hypothetical protein [Candidatus Liptonbacteria bacterium]
MNSGTGSVRAAKIILRWGLAFVFFYAAIASFINGSDWIGYFPKFMRVIVPDHLLLTGFSVFEIILAVWLFLGKKLLWASAISAAMLAGILIFNFDQMLVLFRDVGLVFAALALLELSRPRNQNSDSGE